MPDSELTSQIGQMLMVGFEGTDPESPWPRKIQSQLRQGLIGGVLLFSHNIRDGQQLKDLTASFQESTTDLPPWIAIDQEGGQVQRLKSKQGFLDHLSAKQLAEDFSPEEAQEQTQKLVQELKSYGINLNFAPCVDLDLGSPVISGYGRSFSADAGTVVDYASGVLKVHHDNEVLACIKHFPGHGSAPLDTHETLVDITQVHTKQEFEPFFSTYRPGKSPNGDGGPPRA